MFYPAKMNKISMVVLDEYKDALIRELHELGAVELRRVAGNGSSLLSQARVEEWAKRITYTLMRLDGILELFKIGKFKQESLLSVPPSPEKEVIKDRKSDELLADAEKLLEIEAQLKQIKAELEKLDAKSEEYTEVLPYLRKLQSFDFDLSYLKSSKYFFASVGELPTSNLTRLEEDEGILVFSQWGEKSSVVVVGGLGDEEERIRATLKECGFRAYELRDITSRPAELLKKYTAELRTHADKKRELANEIQEYAGKYEGQILVIKELLEIEKERAEIPDILGRTQRTYVLEGYIPKKNTSVLENILKKNFDGYALLDVGEPEGPEEEIPVLLENPTAVKPFEMLTELFATPRYNEFDPTPLFAPAFLIFFGIMLTDAVYGGIVALVAWYLYKSVGRASPSARNFGIVLGASGLSAVFFGIMFGSYLGDFFSPGEQDERSSLGTELLGLSIAPLWMDPLQRELKYGLSPIIVLLFTSLIIGAVHINIGNFIGLRKAWRSRDVRELLGHAWLVIFQLGVLSILLGLNQVATPLLLIAIVILFYNAGPMGFFGITGYLGDSLSYARLLALSLATGGIAMAINIMTDMMVGIPVAGFFLAVICFIVGHLFNITLNTLGAFVHSLRLHYVEFFSKFYEGGGNKFKPFKVDRKYTRRLEND